jgi:hypothetical protein
MTNRPIKREHQKFLEELMTDPEHRPGPAHARVYGGTNEKRSHNSGMRILNRPDVAAEYARMQAAAREAAPITAEEVTKEITLLARADPRGLFEVYRGACRYCHGDGHQYQRTPREFREAWAKYMRDNGRKDPAGLAFDHLGGVGFNQRHRPHEGCPECFGLGEVYEYLRDSRDWTPGAARLFQGLQRTKDGLKLSTRSQDNALKLAAQMHAMLRERPPGSEDVPPPSKINYEAVDGRRKDDDA